MIHNILGTSLYKIIMVFGSKTISATYDILRGVNATVWSDLTEAKKLVKS